MLHIYPHWNWKGKEGEIINVWCQNNCESVELFLNGKSLGKKNMEKNSHLEWNVPYEPGTLEARGIKNGKTIITKIETTGEPYKIVLVPDRETINGDGEDISVITVSVTDEKGYEVPNTDNLITFDLKGDGKIIGLGNGNPSSHEPDKFLNGGWQRKLFNGKCQIIVQSGKSKSKIVLSASSSGLKEASVDINISDVTPRLAVE